MTRGVTMLKAVGTTAPAVPRHPMAQVVPAASSQPPHAADTGELKYAPGHAGTMAKRAVSQVSAHWDATTALWLLCFGAFGDRVGTPGLV